MNFNNSNRRGGGRGLGPNRLGPGGSCICPQCGKEVEHTTGQPCNQIKCPSCGTIMTRKT